MADARASRRPRQRLTRGVLARRNTLLARIVARASTEFEGYLRFGGEDLAPGAGVILDLLLAALDEERGPTRAELVDYRAYGRGRAEMGIPLNEVLGVWRMSSREILHELAQVARETKVADGVLLVLTNELLDTFDIAIQAYTGGHREVELDRAGREQQARAEAVRSLLLGSAGPADVESAGALWGLDPAGTVVAFRSRPSAAGTAPWLPEDAFVVSVDGDLAGILSTRPPAAAGVVAGVGDPVPLADVAASFAQATRCLEAAIGYGLEGVHDLDGLGLLAAVAADPEVGDRLVRRYLEPLGSGSSAARLRATLECYLENGRRVERTATALHLHENTVRYRIGRFTELTGIDLREPRCAFELWWALQRARMSG